MTRSSVYRLFARLRRAWPASIGLCLVLLGTTAVRAQAAPPSSAAGESEAAKAYRLGIDLIKAGHVDEAISTFKNGLATEPQSTVLLNVIGATYTLTGNFKEAEDYLLQCLQTDPEFVPARKNLAISYFDSGKYNLAVPQFEKLLHVPGESRSVAFLFLGIIAEKQGKFSNSASLLEESGEVAHQYPQALLSLAHSLFELGQAQKGSAVLKSLDAMSGVTASEYFKASLLYSKQSRYEQALTELDRAEKAGPGLPGLAYQRAVVLDQLGRSREALQILEDLTRIKPDADSLNLLAALARKNDDLNLAMQSLRQAALLAPEREVNYLDFSTICMDFENYPLALQAADIGLTHLPGSYRLQVQKGAILEKLGRFQEAEEIVQAASKLQQDNSIALLSLAIIQTHAGELEAAISTLSSAISKYPSNAQMHYYLGVALEQTLAHDARAAQAFRESIRLDPSFADSYYHLAKLDLKEDPKLAEENFRACLRLDPNHLSAEYSLGRLYLKSGRQAEGRALIDAFESQQQAEKLKVQQKPSLELAKR